MIFRHLKRIIKMSYILHKGKGQHLFLGSVWKNTIDNNVITVTPEANNLKTFSRSTQTLHREKGNLIQSIIQSLVYEFHIPTMIKITLFIILKGNKGSINSIFEIIFTQ